VKFLQFDKSVVVSRLDFQLNDSDYKSAMETIINTIIGKANLTRDESEQPIDEPKGFFANLFGRKKKEEKVG